LGKVESTTNSEENKDNKDDLIKIDSEVKEEKAFASPNNQEGSNETSKEKKEEVDKIRTIIKVNEEELSDDKKVETSSNENSSNEKKEENKQQNEEIKKDIPKQTIPKSPQPSASPPSGSREELEQRRNILQSIKDFDFQIKKNQEDISKISEKMDGVTKDLDDLVSLYEIVSEQMNPFVGLSKVTKKRIDALENFTQEIEDIKNRMEDVESVVEKSVGGIKILTKKLKKDDEEFVSDENNNISNLDVEKIEQISEDTEKTQNPDLHTDEEISSEIKSGDFNITSDTESLSDSDLDIILAKSLESFFVEQNIDNMIDDFLLNLK